MSTLKEKIAVSIGGSSILIIAILILIIGPALLFWSINAVSIAAGISFAIPFTFKTWLAGFVFLLLVRGGRK